MSTMTSEREAFGRWFYASKYAQVALPGADDVQRAWDAWQARAHLAQPAQAVDVGAIREVIADMDCDMDMPVTADAWRDKLTRALSGEKAGPVDGWKLVPVEPTPAMRAAFRADPEALTHFTHTTLQCADFDSRYRAMLGAASPAPDKEGL